MLYFTCEVFHSLANQNRGHVRVMLEYPLFIKLTLYANVPAICVWLTFASS